MSLILPEIEQLHLRLLLFATAAAVVTRVVSPWAVLLGGAVMGGNFWLMRQLSGYVLAPERARPHVVVLLGALKQGIFLGLLGLVFWRVRVDPAGFGLGVTVLLVACVATAVRHHARGA